MDLAWIDLTAHRGDSVLHRSSAISKFFFTLCMIISILLADTPIMLGGIAGVLLCGYRLAGISIVEVGHYALYPAIFSFPFAVFQFSISAAAGLTILLKAVTAAMVLLLLLFTTPYPEIFGILHRFLPRVLADGLFFTYRIFFILIKEIQNLLTHVRLRGGSAPYRLILNLKNIAAALGVLFIHSFDLSERMYHMLMIRGYTGRMVTERRVLFSGRDYILAAVGMIVMILVVIL